MFPIDHTVNNDKGNVPTKADKIFSHDMKVKVVITYQLTAIDLSTTYLCIIFLSNTYINKNLIKEMPRLKLYFSRLVSENKSKFECRSIRKKYFEIYLHFYTLT